MKHPLLKKAYSDLLNEGGIDSVRLSEEDHDKIALTAGPLFYDCQWLFLDRGVFSDDFTQWKDLSPKGNHAVLDYSKAPQSLHPVSPTFNDNGVKLTGGLNYALPASANVPKDSPLMAFFSMDFRDLAFAEFASIAEMEASVRDHGTFAFVPGEGHFWKNGTSTSFNWKPWVPKLITCKTPGKQFQVSVRGPDTNPDRKSYEGNIHGTLFDENFDFDSNVIRPEKIYDRAGAVLVAVCFDGFDLSLIMDGREVASEPCLGFDLSSVELLLFSDVILPVKGASLFTTFDRQIFSDLHDAFAYIWGCPRLAVRPGTKITPLVLFGQSLSTETTASNDGWTTESGYDGNVPHSSEKGSPQTMKPCSNDRVVCFENQYSNKPVRHNVSIHSTNGMVSTKPVRGFYGLSGFLEQFHLGREIFVLEIHHPGASISNLAENIEDDPLFTYKENALDSHGHRIYEKFLRQLANFADYCDRRGLIIDRYWMRCLHGTTFGPGYAEAFIELFDRIQEDMRRATGTHHELTALLNFPSRSDGVSNIDFDKALEFLHILDLRENRMIFVQGTRYHLSNFTHLPVRLYAELGVIMGWVAEQIRLHGNYEPFHMVSGSVDGNKATVQFAGLQGILKFKTNGGNVDQMLVAKGFEIVDEFETLLDILTVTIQDETVIIETVDPIPANCKIRYCHYSRFGNCATENTFPTQHRSQDFTVVPLVDAPGDLVDTDIWCLPGEIQL